MNLCWILPCRVCSHIQSLFSARCINTAVFLWNSPLMAPGDIAQTGVVRLRSLQLKGPMPTGTCLWSRLATFLATLTHQTHPPSSATCLVCCTSSVAVIRWNTWSTIPSWPRKSLVPFISDAPDGRCVGVLRSLVWWGNDDANGTKWNVWISNDT